MKRPETTYKKQELTWNKLQRARNDLKQPTTSKKRTETTYNHLKRPTTSKENTWNDLQQADL